MGGITKERLMAWVDDQRQLDPAVKFMLNKLASYADADGVSWSKVETLAAHINRSVRTVQNYLSELKDEGLIVETGGTHRLKDSTRSVPLYQLAPDLLAADEARSMGAKSAPIGPVWVQKSTGMGAAVCTPKDLKDHKLPDGSGARAQADEAEAEAQAVALAAERADFDAVAAEWAVVDPDRVAKPLAWPEWRQAVGRCAGGSAGLARAARRYLAESRDVADKRCKAFERWLRDDRWEGWLGAACGRAAGATATWAGPPEVRAKLAAANGEGWVGSYLDRARWDETARSIHPRNSIALDALTNAVRAGVLAGLNVTIGEIERVGG